MADAPQRRPPTWLVAAAVVAGLLSLYLLLQGFGTFLIFWAIFAPIIIAGVLVVRGTQRCPGGLLWVSGAGLAMIPAAYMSFASLCSRGEGNCPESLTNSHKAVWALVALGLAWAVLFLVRSDAGRRGFIALATFGMVWMIIRMREAEDMGFGALLLIILLVGAVVFEIARYLRARAIEQELQQIAAGGGPPPPATT